MASLKMVRCTVEREEGGARSLRYVPLDIFGLWSYLMRTRHGFRLLDTETAIWLDIENNPDVSVSSHHLERVDEICLHVFSEKDSMFRRICRYFQVAERDSLTRILLRHYGSGVYEDVRHPQIIERAGVWIRRQS